jgi:hypothetical protein
MSVEPFFRRPVGVAPDSDDGRLTVVCDDGSVWQYHYTDREWKEIPPIPGSKRESGA